MRFVSMFLLIFCMIAVAYAGGENPSNCSLQNVVCVNHQFIGADDCGTWAPEKGVILFYGTENDQSHEGVFNVFLYFDQDAVSWYEDNLWAGFEVDISFPGRGNYTLPRIDPDTVAGPPGTMPVRDTIIGDVFDSSRAITVVKPKNLRVGWNGFTFALKRGGVFANAGEGVRIKANIQLVANVAHSNFVRTVYNSNSEWWSNMWVVGWLEVGAVGYYISGGHNDGYGETFKFFAMSGAQHATKEPFFIYPNTNGKGFYWDHNTCTVLDDRDYAQECTFLDITHIPSNAVIEDVENEIEQISHDALTDFVESKTGIHFSKTNPPQQQVIDPGHTGSGGFNDMKIKTVNMSKGAHSTRHKTLHQEPGEKFYAYAKLDNDGSATAYDFKLKFYIDGGKRNFDRDDDDYQGSIRIDEYNSDAKIRYAKELTAPDKPGTYWVYACVTSIDHDEDKDNNCSDEDDREEWGKLIIDGNPDASSTSKSWDDLTSGEKAAIMQIIFSRRR